MKASIVTIGNSKGIRIPKPLLEESGLKDKVEITATRGEIKIVPVEEPDDLSSALLAETALGDWNKPEEDEAWSNLQ
jgi:antitoxin component of MazEF toxin-antitoxin module